MTGFGLALPCDALLKNNWPNAWFYERRRMEMAKGDYSTFCVIEYAPVVELLIDFLQSFSLGRRATAAGHGIRGRLLHPLGAASEHSTRIIIK